MMGHDDGSKQHNIWMKKNDTIIDCFICLFVYGLPTIRDRKKFGTTVVEKSPYRWWWQNGCTYAHVTSELICTK